MARRRPSTPPAKVRSRRAPVPCEWPAARSNDTRAGTTRTGDDMIDVVAAGDYASVLRYPRGRGCTDDVLSMLSHGGVRAVTVGFRLHHSIPLFLYGHLYAVLTGFTEALLASGRGECAGRRPP
eukprot:2711671-Prymnesium_polylepis.1